MFMNMFMNLPKAKVLFFWRALHVSWSMHENKSYCESPVHQANQVNQAVDEKFCEHVGQLSTAPLPWHRSTPGCPNPSADVRCRWGACAPARCCSIPWPSSSHRLKNPKNLRKCSVGPPLSEALTDLGLPWKLELKGLQAGHPELHWLLDLACGRACHGCVMSQRSSATRQKAWIGLKNVDHEIPNKLSKLESRCNFAVHRFQTNISNWQSRKEKIGDFQYQDAFKPTNLSRVSHIFSSNFSF